ncbi:MAG: hypothetical protein KJ069_13555 [Anaerolineae bacterium]|nr:hypothetical protein [Anaerolineae bacterium]
MTINQTTHHPSFRLAATPTTLPYHPTPPVLCACLQERVFIFSRHEANDEVWVTSIDLSGNMTSLSPLPVPFVAGIMPCKNEIHILGSRGQAFYDLHLDHEGSVLRETALPTGQDLLLTPQIACGSPAIYFWIDAQGQLHVRQGEQLSTTSLSDLTLELVAATTPTGLAFLRAAGIPGYLELIHYEAGHVRQIQAIAGSEQGYCPLLFWRGDHYLLLWVSRPSRSIRLQKLAADFSPVAQAHTLLTLDYPTTFRWLRCLAASEGDIVLAWQTEQPGDGMNQQGIPLPDLSQYVALLDPVQPELKEVTAVNFTADSYFTGCLRGQLLIVVLGGGQATVLTYQVN